MTLISALILLMHPPAFAPVTERAPSVTILNDSMCSQACDIF
jgi:hypothetical protein